MRGALSSFHYVRALALTNFTEHSVLNVSPFDLHVLGTPPAFVLSQDQTLHKIYEENLIAQIVFTHLTSHWLFLVV